MTFWKSEACGQTEFPGRSILIGQKLAENARIEKFKWDILGDFQTLWDIIFWQNRILFSGQFGQKLDNVEKYVMDKIDQNGKII